MFSFSLFLKHILSLSINLSRPNESRIQHHMLDWRKTAVSITEFTSTHGIYDHSNTSVGYLSQANHKGITKQSGIDAVMRFLLF
jgi:hypothetical protein